MTLGLFKTVSVLLRARLRSNLGVLTLFVDGLVLVLGENGVVGLDLVFLEHSLIAAVCQYVPSCRWGGCRVGSTQGLFIRVGQ